MELRQYWRIIWRRIWVPILLVVLVSIITFATRHSPPQQYVAKAQMLVDVPPLESMEGMGFDPRLTAPQATEYLVDDFSVFVTGQQVAEGVSRRLADEGLTIPAGIIQSSTSSQQLHRAVVIQVTWNDPAQAVDIVNAAIDYLREEAPAYFARLGAMQPEIRVFDGPTVYPLPPSLTQRLDVPIRLLLALLAGLALCFVLDYLDPSVRGREELEGMQIQVLAQVPKTRRKQ